MTVTCPTCGGDGEIEPERGRGRCSVASCGDGVEFLVDHPQRGNIEVCGWHAENIEAAGGEVVGVA